MPGSIVNAGESSVMDYLPCGPQLVRDPQPPSQLHLIGLQFRLLTLAPNEVTCVYLLCEKH